MAPFFRSRSGEATMETVEENQSLEESTTASKSNGWELRKKRLARKNKERNDDTTRRRSRSAPAAEEDPYESDPGESYRDHCMKFKGISTKSCLGVPKFLRNSRSQEVESELTSPPSPLASEMGDIFGHTPASLPAHLTRVRYSLRSSITDGAEKQPVGPSVMERRELRPNGIHLNVSHWSDEGGRPYMEDRYCVENLDAVQVEVSPAVDVKSNSQDVEVTYGRKRTQRLTMPLTQFCADWMTAYLRNDKSYPYDLGYAMKNTFLSVDDDFVRTGQPDGSTACAVTLVGGRRVVCANAGDSRAIIVRRDGSIVRLSRDHKPGLPDETRRITELGGRVIHWGRWRVEGLLSVSRSIGDASLKPYVIADPEICEYDIGKDDLFLIVSSDGIWDVLDNEEAAHVVIASSCAMEHGKLMIDTDRFKWAARNLCEHAKSCGSTDNFSAVVVDLKSCGNSMAMGPGRYEP